MRELGLSTVSTIELCARAVEVDPVPVVLIDSIVASSIANPRRWSTMAQAIDPEFRRISTGTVTTIVVQLGTVEMVPFVRVITESISDP
jgi:hypothetical protein